MAKMTKAEIETTAVKLFEWQVNFLIIRFRFVHQILGMMHKTPDYKIPTMGVWVLPSGMFELRYNPVWVVEALTQANTTYIFYHEILHLALLHCTKRRLGEKKLANIAQDLAVNELIPITYGICEPPIDKEGNLEGCFVSEFKKIPMFKDIESKRTAEWYYDYLRKKRQQSGSPEESGNGSFDTHEGWAEHEVANERVSAKIRNIQDMDSWGDISSTTREMVLAAQIKKINWRNLIRVWFGNQAWKDRIYTRKRPNRRTGLMHPGTRRSYVDRWLVAADTSGSIDSDLLGEWLGILNQLADDLPIDFMQFDCDKTQDPHPYERRRFSLEFHGRGGTNFQPVMDIVEQRRYKGVMILTDGEAPEPTKPGIAQVLWVLPIGKNPPCEWGTIIHMQKYA
jgi:predicted metal-dependent peptidase